MFKNCCKLKYKKITPGYMYQTDAGDESLKMISSQRLDFFKDKQNVTIRIHSSCFASEQIGSLDCDCNDQLKSSIWYISNISDGILFYLNQEGRGHGISKKISIINTMEQKGCDTYDACDLLGLESDVRVYDNAIQIIKTLNIRSIKLISNNPLKKQAFTKNGIKVSQYLRLPTHIREENKEYLLSKRDKKWHKMPEFNSNKANKIHFYNPNEMHGYLSNLALYKMKIGAHIWHSVEHFYKAHKYINPEINNDINLKNLRQFESKNNTHSNWESIKIAVMYAGLHAKFTQHSELRRQLIQTSDAILVENSTDDYFWGIGKDESGENWMGKLLMILREDLVID